MNGARVGGSLLLLPVLALLPAACGDGTACDGGNPLMPVCSATAPPIDEPVLFMSTRHGPLEVYRMNSDGTRQVRLTNNPGQDLTATWSPDGRQILFASVRGGLARQLYVMNEDGSDVRRLTNQTGEPGFADWSPDGRHIAYHAARGDGNWDLWVMNTDGTEPRRLLTQGGGQRPRWSPDGRRILFLWHQHMGNNRVWSQIALINPDGTGLQPLGDEYLQGTDPAWSPDGRQIAFSIWVTPTGNLQGMTRVAVMNADGSGLRILGMNTMGAMDVDWSRASGRIYFASAMTGYAQVYSILPDGTDLRRLTGLVQSSDQLPRVR